VTFIGVVSSLITETDPAADLASSFSKLKIDALTSQPVQARFQKIINGFVSQLVK